MTSSDAVVKGVAKKLKYYFDIKRLEDGFDLSGVNSPQLDHPPLKSRATLQYDGLHDRALKHYFSLPEVRCKLTNMGPKKKESTGDGEHREEKVKRKLKRRMNRYDYKPKTHPAFLFAQAGRDTSDVIFPLKGNRKSLKGGWPQLRSVPSQNITRGEAQRLVNIATKLLVATETVDIIQPRPPSPKRAQSAPKPFETERSLPGLDDQLVYIPVDNPKGQNKDKKRPATAKYTWDIHGRRHANEKEKPRAYDDSYSPKRSTHNPSKDDRPEQRRVIIKKVVRSKPASTTPTTTTDQPEKSERSARSDRSSRSQKSDRSLKSDRSPKSDRSGTAGRSARSGSVDSETASTTDRSSSEVGTKTTSSNSSKVQTRPGTHKSTVIHVRDTDIREEVKVSHSTQAGDSVSIQTETHMIDKYNPLDDEIKQGDWAEYQIYVRTGNRTGASASANIEVKLTLYGDKGRTKELVLQDSKRHLVMFQRGKEDLFVLACHHVGKLRKIKIGHDRTSLRDAWYLEGVTVYDMHDKRIYEFNCERWLSAHDGDRKTYRVLEMDRDRAFIEALHGDDDKSTSGSISESETESSTPRDRRHQDSKSSGSSVRVRGGKDIRYRKKDLERGSDSDSSYTSDSSSEQTTDRTPKIRPLSPLRKPDEDDFFDVRGSGPTFLFRDGRGPPPKESESVHANVSVDSATETSEDTSTRAREDFLEGYKSQPYKVGLKAAEEDSKVRTSEEVAGRKRVLAGPTIHEAAQAGNLARVQELLQHYSEMKESKDESGRTPLHLASTDGHIDVVKWLAIGEANLNLETPTGYTAMHLSAMNGHVNCMMILFALGASISVKTSDKKTPLYLAAMKGHLECVKWLIANRARFDTVDDMDRTPRMVAEDFGHRDVADFLKACENEMNDPNSGFAQMRTTSKLGPGGLQTIEEDSNSSVSQEDKTWQDDKDNYSDKAGVGSDGGSQRAKSARTIHREKETKKKIYEEQHQKMEETGDSFLDSIRHEFDTRPEP